MLKELFNVTGTGELFKNPTLPPRVIVPVPRGPLLTLPALSVELAPWTLIVPPLSLQVEPVREGVGRIADHQRAALTARGEARVSPPDPEIKPGRVTVKFGFASVMYSVAFFGIAVLLESWMALAPLK